jgi:hypothetical protein
MYSGAIDGRLSPHTARQILDSESAAPRPPACEPIAVQDLEKLAPPIKHSGTSHLGPSRFCACLLGERHHLPTAEWYLIQHVPTTKTRTQNFLTGIKLLPEFSIW